MRNLADTWPEIARVELARIWNAGASAAQCADILTPIVGRPLTRNSILGMVLRLRKSGVHMESKGETAAARKIRHAAEGRGVVAASRSVDDRMGIFPARSECIWPIGDPGTAGFRFCCARREKDRRYCNAHYAVAFREKPEKSDQPMVIGPRGR